MLWKEAYWGNSLEYLIWKKMGRYITHYKKFYQWCEEDLWGLLSLSKKNSKSLSYLYDAFKANPKKRFLIKRKLYKIRFNLFTGTYAGRFMYQVGGKEKEFKRKKRYFRSKEHFLLFKLKTFYGNVRTKVISKLLAGSKRNQNIWSPAGLLLLEGRLDIILYRTGLFKSIFSIRQILKHKGVLINGKPVYRSNHRVNLGDMVIIPSSYYKNLYESYVNKLKCRQVLSNLPRYIEADYRLGIFTIVSPPLKGEVAFPFRLDAKMHRFEK